MKIAIYHNLESGGALLQANEIVKDLQNDHHVEIFSYNNNLKTNTVKNIIALNKPRNILHFLYRAIVELDSLDRLIANKINSNFDLTLVFPCLIRQSPHILKYLKSSIYFFAETKREYYEDTSFDKSIKHKLAHYICYPLKIIDVLNCKSAKIIVSNSYYSKRILEKIYNKNSFVIHPAKRNNKFHKVCAKNNYGVISVGQLSKTKGHDFSILQSKKVLSILNIIGREISETSNLYELSRKNKIKLNIIKTDNNSEKQHIMQKHSIYLANNHKEPFGLATLEAISNKIFVLGKNESGTAEIVRSGIDGVLYPHNLRIAKNILKDYLSRKEIKYITCQNMSWKNESHKLLSIYHLFKK